MATYTTDVEVSLSDFGDKDIIAYVKNKMLKNVGFATYMQKELSLSVIEIKIPIDSVADKMKLEFIQDNWDKITLDKLENCIK